MAKRMTVVFDDLELTKSLLELVSRAESSTQSKILEYSLYDKYLPKDKNLGKIVIEDLLLSKNARACLVNTFEYNSAGINFKSISSDYFELVELCKNKLIFQDSELTGDEPRLHHLLKNFELLLEKLELEKEKLDCSDKDIFSEKSYLEVEISLAKSIFDDFKSDIRQAKLFNILEILSKNWKYLKDWTITYRLLKDVIFLEKKFPNDEKTQYEILLIMKNL